MTVVLAVLGLSVAVLYIVIGAFAVPRLARSVSASPLVLLAARGGAMLFFFGCAWTHLAIASEALHDRTSHGMSSAFQLGGHLVPHVVQVVGGLAFVITLARYLEIRVVPRDQSQEVRRLEDRLRQALDASGLGAWETDLATGAMWISPRCAEIFGFVEEPSAWERQLMLQRVDPAVRDEVSQRLAEIEELGSVNVECPLVVDGDAERWVSIDATLVRDDAGEPLRVVGTVADITARKLHDAEADALTAQLHHAQRVEAVGQMASGVAHDFNNLLTVIDGWSELLERNPSLDDTARKQLGAIADATQRGLQLTRQLTSFTRRDRARVELVDVNAVVEEVVTMASRLVDRGITIRTDVAPVAPVAMEQGALVQLLLNLTTNARDAMPRGGTMTFFTRPVTEPDHAPSSSRVHVGVTDTGIGMDAAIQQRVLEPFFTTKPAGSGTGLGLSVVNNMVTHAGGHLEIVSALGEGTTITMCLPAAADTSA